MIATIKLFLCVLLSAGVFLFAATPLTMAASNPLDPACNANQETKQSPLCKQAKAQGTKDPIAGPDGIISKAANIIALVASVGAVLMILIGGFFYVTSAGNAENAKKAKDRIVAALIGLVIIALAWTIVRLITDKVIG